MAYKGNNKGDSSAHTALSGPAKRSTAGRRTQTRTTAGAPEAFFIIIILV